MNAVRKAGEVSCPETRRVAAEAFRDDPMWRYVLPDDLHRIRALPEVLPLDYAQGYGEVWVTPSPICGVAAWLRPGDTAVSYWRFLRTGAARCAANLGPAAFKR